MSRCFVPVVEPAVVCRLSYLNNLVSIEIHCINKWAWLNIFQYIPEPLEFPAQKYYVCYTVRVLYFKTPPHEYWQLTFSGLQLVSFFSLTQKRCDIWKTSMHPGQYGTMSNYDIEGPRWLHFHWVDSGWWNKLWGYRSSMGHRDRLGFLYEINHYIIHLKKNVMTDWTRCYKLSSDWSFFICNWIFLIIIKCNVFVFVCVGYVWGLKPLNSIGR